jgi:hypothetical protein
MIRNAIAMAEVRHNQSSRHLWDRFALHRARVSSLLIEAAPENRGTLCVLGAGNCNDLELVDLVKRYRRVHLVDIDDSALRGGVERQLGRDAHDSVVLHGGVDLGGLAMKLSSCKPKTGARNLIDELRTPTSAIVDDGVDVMASACVLSQLIGAVARTLGERHPLFSAAVLAVRQSHLRQMHAQLGHGGRAVLITDFVSSDTCKELPGASSENLPALMLGLVRDKNFFYGLNPIALHSALLDDAALNAQIEQVELTGRWRWHHARRTYAVIALKFQKLATRIEREQ